MDTPDAPDALAFQPLLSWGLGLLGTHDARLDNELLKDLVFVYPTRLESVCRYVLARHKGSWQHEDSHKTVRSLVANVRESPWAMLWLLHTLGELPAASSTPDGQYLQAWVVQQLGDRHETVRAEAFWSASSMGILQEESLIAAYKEASLLSQPALAAAVSRHGGVDKSLAAAIRDDNPLNQKAFEWAANQTQAT